MSLTNDALKKAESLQPSVAPASTPVPGAPLAAAGTVPLVAPVPAAVPAPAAPTSTPSTPAPLRLSLATAPSAVAHAAATPSTPPPAAPAAGAPAPGPLRLTLSPTPPAAAAVPPTAPAPASAAQAGTTPLRLSLSTPPPAPPPAPPPPPAAQVAAPTIRLGTPAATPASPPVTTPSLQPLAATALAPAPSAAPDTPLCATPPPPPAPAAEPATPPDPASSEATTLEALRLQYKQAGASDALASEKAIAAAALEPPGLTFRLAAPETMAQAESVVVVATPPVHTPATPSLPPGSINPLTGLRVPTPELAAAFLASSPVPAGAAPGTAPAPETPANGPRTPPPVPEKIRSGTPPRSLPKKSANPESILLVVGGILAVLLGGGLTAAYLVFRDKPAPKSAQVAVEGETDESGEPIDSGFDPEAADAPAVTSDQPASTAEPAPVAAAEPTPPPDPNAAATVTAAAPAGTPVTPNAEPTPPPPPQPHINRPDPTISAWVQKIQLTGIRSGPVPKVFMNGKLYEAGEVVNYELNLRLTSATGKVLHFEDAEGNTYEYRF